MNRFKLLNNEQRDTGKMVEEKAEIDGCRIFEIVSDTPSSVLKELDSFEDTEKR